jgi:glucose-1-phosphate cytidylyltransferase
MTGGRLKRVAPYLKNEEAFCFTYGDGVADVDIKALIEFHKEHGKEATLTATYPPGRFGALEIVNNEVRQFQEKPRGDGALINGGFFVLSPKVIDRIKDDSTIWEQEPLKGLATDNQLMAFKHEGFWQPMDTLRDKYYLEELIETNKAPWKVWAD